MSDRLLTVEEIDALHGPQKPPLERIADALERIAETLVIMSRAVSEEDGFVAVEINNTVRTDDCGNVR